MTYCPCFVGEETGPGKVRDLPHVTQQRMRTLTEACRLLVQKRPVCLNGWRGLWASSSLTSACLFQSVQQNGSMYIHVYFTKSGFHPDPKQKALYRRLATVHTSRSKALSAPAGQAEGIGGQGMLSWTSAPINANLGQG